MQRKSLAFALIAIAHMRQPAVITGLLDWLVRARRRLRSLWQLAAARREFDRLDAAALRDLGIGPAELSSYWAEASGIAERTRRRTATHVISGGATPASGARKPEPGTTRPTVGGGILVRTKEGSYMSRLIGFIYGVAAYLLFLVVILYAIGFAANWLVPKSIDSGTQGDLLASMLMDAALIGVFAVQHSVMARPGFKAWWTRVIPPAMERSTYVMLSNLVLMLLLWQWQPLPGVVWNVEQPVLVAALWALCALGWATVFASSFAINHFDLFGLRQVYLNLRAVKCEDLPFRIGTLYRLVRHPLMLGFVIALWATPRMTQGHLLFAVGLTLYILVALQLEERDLVAHFGDKYERYQSEVPMLLPLPRKGGGPGERL